MNTDFLKPLPRILISLAVGCVGGLIFSYIGVPLAWMLGAMMATSLVSIAGYKTDVPSNFRLLMLIVIGVLIGSSFSPDVWKALGSWSISLVGLFVAMALSVVGALAFLHLVGKYDPVTTYFASMPGGLSEMVAMGGHKGGSEADIVLIHSARVMLVVFAVPLTFQFIIGGMNSQPVGGFGNGSPIMPIDVFWLGLCGVAGFLAGHFGLPAGHMLGALVASAIVHSLGLTHVSPPSVIVAAAQVVIGSSLGSRFAGHKMGALMRTLAISAGLTLILLIAAVMVALVVAAITDLPVSVLVLAYAPGGVSEMSLVALALDVDPTLVSAHHLVRIFTIVTIAPFCLGIWQRALARWT